MLAYKIKVFNIWEILVNNFCTQTDCCDMIITHTDIAMMICPDFLLIKSACVHLQIIIQ